MFFKVTSVDILVFSVLLSRRDAPFGGEKGDGEPKPQGERGGKVTNVKWEMVEWDDIPAAAPRVEQWRELVEIATEVIRADKPARVDAGERDPKVVKASADAFKRRNRNNPNRPTAYLLLNYIRTRTRPGDHFVYVQPRNISRAKAVLRAIDNGLPPSKVRDLAERIARGEVIEEVEFENLT